MSERPDGNKTILTYAQPFGLPGNEIADLIRVSTVTEENLARANDNVPSADPILTLPGKANVSYELRAFVCFRSESGTPNLELGFSGPGGADGAFLGVGINIDSSNVQHAAQVINGTRTVALTGGTTRLILMQGEVALGDVEGNISVIWSQANSNAEPTVRLQRSWFHLINIAAAN